ncbi:DUF2939 domain-containing protein [Acetobacter sp. AN02]|uniref:DUF2939 domain-containing protein n=1 Tax=Acetobacter sp. AN02 TaxID=2894186 RepID=UPI0024345682|nr:DUF2939 domain-containing protein [Acetobacter sp. AN02]MDG6093578.1 DUF2939 domain-containing protein [Acetobacter sp. AN02]
MSGALAITAPADITTARVSAPAVFRVRARRLCLASFVCAFVLFLASPLITLWNISAAIQSGNMEGLGRSINWGSLDSCLKQQILAGLNLDMSPPSDELPDFGSSFAVAAVSSAIDHRLTQENIGSVVGQIFPDGIGAQAVSSGTVLSVLQHASGRFSSYNVFEARVVLPGHEKETPLGIQLKIEGWRWKLTRVDLPVARPVVAGKDQAGAGRGA